jgi:two-component system, chemotaxis family, CheB/CheR fusion protein
LRAVFGGGELIERSVRLADGKGHYLARIHPYRDSGNAIDGVVATFVDITSVVAAEEQQKVLAAELSHRVNNTLAVVSSIAQRTLPDGDAKTDLVGRFHALAHTHDLLSSAGWTEARLREVISTELAPYGAHVTVNGPQFMLKPQTALFLALVFHELATNAAKYGALSTPAGRVEIAWMIVRDPPSRLELSWIEQGGPEIDRLASHGFGTELIDRGIRFELQGEAELGFVDGSLDCRIVVPADPKYISFASPLSRPAREEAAS